ncbi:MAG: polysaccharide deacetylase family protein [Gemmatimonadota bacterium]
MRSSWIVGLVFVAACDGAGDRTAAATPAAADTPNHPTRAAVASAGSAASDDGPRTELAPNELGRIPVVEYHLIGAEEARWTRTPENFRNDLELLHARGYRPVSLRHLAAAAIDLPAGTSPVVFTFDDASPGQFSYVEENGELRIDPRSAVGIWLDFAGHHPEWRNEAVFCVLSGAEAGRSFFGDKGIEAQKSEWRHRKVKFLADQGFELCNHTLWHATLSKYDDAFAQEQIARLQLAVDSAVPGYRIRSFALPLGDWPTNRSLAARGSWTNPKTGETTSYEHDIVLLVAGGPARSPHDPEFDPLRVPRVQVFADELVRVLDQLDRTATRYVSDGDPATIARPPVPRPPQ